MESFGHPTGPSAMKKLNEETTKTKKEGDWNEVKSK